MNTTKPDSEQIDDIIKLYGGWKAEVLSGVRAAIKQAAPDVTEEVKWRMKTRPEGLPVWYQDGIFCLAETFKNDIKIVFTKGAEMDELQEHFNARLKSSTDRAIEYHEGDKVDESVIRRITREAVRLNRLKVNR
jgi:hypothetical protein